MKQRDPIIVGIGLSDGPKAPHLDYIGHHVLAARRALADAGLTLGDIDGYVSAGDGPHKYTDDAMSMAEYLGIEYRWMDGTMVGGSSFEYHVQHAAAALQAGDCETVLITYGSDRLTRLGRTLGTGFHGIGDEVGGPPQYEAPYGLPLIGAYAMAAQRHAHEFGTTPEQLAEIAVSTRLHAAHNPDAMYREPLTIDDVLSSRPIADPLRKLDCCLVTDGGGAIVMTTRERAVDAAGSGVAVLGTATAQTHWNPSQMPDYTTTAAATAGPRALAQAGVSIDDIDLVQLYDSFTITVLLLLEDLGFCAKGDGGSFVQDGRLRPGGALPLNTDGGGLSAQHPGMRGIFLLIEAVRQLRHDAGEAQVSDAEVALACGVGGWLSCVGTVVLGRL